MKTFHKIETKVLKFIILFGHVLETVLAILIMIGLIISLKPLVLAMGELGSGMEEVLPHFLEAAFNLVIGIEFVDMLTKQLASEFGPFGITVNGFGPNIMATPMMNKIFEMRAKENRVNAIVQKAIDNATVEIHDDMELIAGLGGMLKR